MPGRAELDIIRVYHHEFRLFRRKSHFTGVIYRDLDGDGFYTPGEGSKYVIIIATPTTGGYAYRASTFRSGGYSLPLPPGTYNILAHAASGTYELGVVSLSTDNVKLDANLLSATHAHSRVPPQICASGSGAEEILPREVSRDDG